MPRGISPSKSESLQRHWGTLERNKTLVILFQAGKSFAEIARMVRDKNGKPMSRQNVEVIVKRELKRNGH